MSRRLNTQTVAPTKTHQTIIKRVVAPALLVMVVATGIGAVALMNKEATPVLPNVQPAQQSNAPVPPVSQAAPVPPIQVPNNSAPPLQPILVNPIPPAAPINVVGAPVVPAAESAVVVPAPLVIVDTVKPEILNNHPEIEVKTHILVFDRASVTGNIIGLKIKGKFNQGAGQLTVPFNDIEAVMAWWLSQSDNQ
jgi:hypothetical protein